MSCSSGWSFPLVVIFLFISDVLPVPVFQFVRSPGNLTSSLGKPARVWCSLQGEGGGEEEPPDLVWLRDGQTLEYADTNQVQMPVREGSWLTISELRIERVTLSDIGRYRCMATVGRQDMLSSEGCILLEGIPHFSVEPGDFRVEANSSFSLCCVAHGPPEPVRVIWLQNGEPLNTLQDPFSLSPSSLNVTAGLNQSSSFTCEAHNSRGVATSSTGTVTVIPTQAQRLTTAEASNSSLLISWELGFGGLYPVTVCSVQATQSLSDPVPQHRQLVHNQNVDVPPAVHLIPRLEPYSSYDVRVSCRSSQGAAAWTPWVALHTSEGVPEAAPANVRAVFNGTEVHVNWTEPPGRLNGPVKGYRVEYSTSNMSQAVVKPVQWPELVIPVSGLLETVTLRVCACTKAGCGPWSLGQTLQHKQLDVSHHQVFSWHWWYVVMLIAVTLALIGFIAAYAIIIRRKKACFGKEFYPMRNGGDFVVRYSARRSYNRQANEATLNSLVISDELKHKLQDVMVDRHKLTLGKTLGEGEFGSVMEGLLVHGEAVLRVAVKTMKISICTRSEMEDFLKEAACMKEFDHPNVMRLVGVCLQTVERGGYPSPVVILPHMKHGDLHSFLLYSRLGDNPLPLSSQMLVKFMADIARGMEYLSNKRFIHRDLAARNCMLNENLTVCVADFGLSKKIHNGDYYRQGNISKMPVKWIAIESLADRVYTTKSDVWSFGVTMWEIATRGRTPYPGVENSEIYDHLRQGNRLKQPLGCLDNIYSLMFSCWLLSPKDRPGFGSLRYDLEQALEEMPEQEQLDEDLLYVNMEEPGTLLGAVGGREPSGSFQNPQEPFWMKGREPAQVHQAERYVLCPPRQARHPYLNESMDSLSWMASSTNTTLQLQTSRSSTPLSSLTTDGLDEREDRAASRQ